MIQYWQGYYNVYLVACSFLISVLTSYFAIDTAVKIRKADSSTRTVLLVGGSFSIGTGLWSMQFMSILALESSLQVRYDVWLTLLSLLWPVAASLAALLLISRKHARISHFIGAGLSLGMGISMMHYTAISAIRSESLIRYDLFFAIGSMGITLALSLAAFILRPNLDSRLQQWKLTSASILGIAICAIHQIGIKAATFNSDRVEADRYWSFAMTPTLLAVVMGIVTVIIFCFAILFATIGKQLRTSQSHHHSLFEQNPDMIFSIDPEGVILNTNMSVLTAAGYDKPHCVGRSFFDFVAVDDHKPFREFFQRSVQGESFEFVIQFHHADGSIRHVFIRTVPMTDEGGTQGVYIIGRDITETKANREKFETLSRTHSLILNSINEGVYGIDVQAKTIFWNAASERMTGFSFDEVANRSIHRLFHHTRADGTAYPEDECPVIRSLVSGVPVHVNDELFWRKDGSSFSVEYRVYPVRDEHMPLGAVVTFNDITERKRTEELMLSSEKLSVAGQLAAGIAHEIRNPLTAIKGFLQLMNAGTAKKSYMDVIFSEMDRIELIITELLVLAKPQPSKREQKPIIPLLNHVITLLESQANIHNIMLVREYEEPSPTILCDENQLKQVFINMIKNAIESMTDGGFIFIRVKRLTLDSFSVEVEDQGCGIPPERLGRLGEPFYSTKEKGTGLGLMVSKKILANHGGTLKVTSAVNKGTKIEVSFPGKSGIKRQAWGTR
ncbi:PAS domain S-box protein [Paenibacillus filicis]|uniref:histidine kinase n=1 Tax=Paenibacillus filicis TaxID=669464 RepID=A0ABU9DDD9_9BACL